MNWPVLSVVVAAYILGSVPIGILVSRVWAGIDPRHAGSGNIGFTNVLRVAGTVPGLMTLLGDMGKGALAVLAARMVIGDTDLMWEPAVGLAAILGHIFPVFLGFKGGKGVATALGVILAIDPLLGGVLVLIWTLAAALWRTSSLAAIVAFAVFPLLVVLLEPEARWMLIFSMIVTALIEFRHKGNMRRLFAGNEPKFRRFHVG